MNKTIEKFARDQIKQKLGLCTEAQQLLFKRMYSHSDLNLPNDEVVNKISSDKLDWALTQIERTLDKIAA